MSIRKRAMVTTAREAVDSGPASEVPARAPVQSFGDGQMNAHLVPGMYTSGIKKRYRSKCGRHYFGFEFVDRGGHVDVYCQDHPSLNGRDSDPRKTHLYRSGKVCFIAGHEPGSQRRAEQLAAQWAEYFLEYRRTGIAQS